MLPACRTADETFAIPQYALTRSDIDSFMEELRGFHTAFRDLSLSRLWYTGPPMKGGTTYGQGTVHRCAGPLDRVPRFHQLNPRRVSAPRPALRDGVPRTDGRVAPRWETPGPHASFACIRGCLKSLRGC